MRWLDVRDDAGQLRQRLPEAALYQEIYAEKNAWWRLMNPAWVDPAPKLSAKNANGAWGQCIKNLRKAESYHSIVGDHSHNHTHIHCGADNTNHRAFGTISWHPNSRGNLLANPLLSQHSQESKKGTVHMPDVWMRNGRISNPANFVIANQDEPGDGTVPRRSGAALAHKAELAAEHAGYDHQDSYKDRRTQELVAYGVIRMVSENMV